MLTRILHPFLNRSIDIIIEPGMQQVHESSSNSTIFFINAYFSTADWVTQISIIVHCNDFKKDK